MRRSAERAADVGPMAISAEEHPEAALGPAETSAAPSEPRRSTLGRLAHYGGLFKRGLHFRYKLVNLFCALLPDVASGAVRGRLYRLAGFDVDKAAFLMGNLRPRSAGARLFGQPESGPGGGGGGK